MSGFLFAVSLQELSSDTWFSTDVSASSGRKKPQKGSNDIEWPGDLLDPAKYFGPAPSNTTHNPSMTTHNFNKTNDKITNLQHHCSQLVTTFNISSCHLIIMVSVLANHHSNVPIDLKTLTPDETRYQICMFLSQRLNRDGKLRKTALAETAEAFGRKKESVRHLWRKHKKAIVNPHKFKLDLKRKMGTGRKRLIEVSDVMKRVKAVPFRYRQTYRSLSSQVGIPKTTLYRLMKSGILQKSRSAVKPMLTEASKV